jgi:transcriptional regulator with XRE-family HTH domain
MSNEFKEMMERARQSLTFHVEDAIMEFTEDMVTEMEKQDVNRSELARRIDSSPAYVTKILRGSTNFTLESMVKIARALGCRYRCHLEPDGCETKWIDVARTRSCYEYTKLKPIAWTSVVNEPFTFDKPFSNSEYQEKEDDSFALAS